MKKIIFAIGLFLVIIGIWSFSWASTDVLVVDTNVLSFGLGDLDCTEDIESHFSVDVTTLDNCLAWTYDNKFYVQFSSGYFFVYDNKIVSQYNSYGIVYDSNGDFYGTLGDFNIYDFADYIDITTLNWYYHNLTCNALYSDNSFEYIYDDNITDYNNTTFFSNAFNYSGGGSEPQVQYFEPVLMIDDYNFKKSFKYTFKIPKIRQDTKYYVFLKNYTRNSYTSVTSDFVIITVTTPQDYDFSQYYNYLYYDDLSEKIYLPGGTEVHFYTASGSNNSILNLTEIELFSNIIPHFNLGSITNLFYNNINTNTIFSTYTYNDLIPTTYYLQNNSIGKLITTILNNLELKVSNESNSLTFNIIDTFLQYTGLSNITSDEFRRSYYLRALYYGIDEPGNNVDLTTVFNVFQNFKNFAFGNYNIISYQNSKFDTAWSIPYYALYRSTKVYDCENEVNSNLFRFNYSDKQDISSLLPSGVSADYLSSPFYQDNYNSSSGGYITYNITNVLYGDNPINYGDNSSSIRIEPTQDFLQNDDDTDNSTLNNETTQTIDNTSNDNLLHNIYLAILKIQDILSKQSISNENTYNNITYNIQQNFNYFFIPERWFL